MDTNKTPKITASSFHPSRQMSKIQQAIEGLGHLNSPYYLKQLGYTDRDIKKAVEAGEVEWTRDGNLNIVE